MRTIMFYASDKHERPIAGIIVHRVQIEHLNSTLPTLFVMRDNLMYYVDEATNIAFNFIYLY